jgi:hypothetical protein
MRAENCRVPWIVYVFSHGNWREGKQVMREKGSGKGEKKS